MKLNEAVLKNSSDSQLVLLNMPGPPKNKKGDENCILFSAIAAVHLVNESFSNPVSQFKKCWHIKE